MSWTHFACIGRLSATCCGAGIILERRFESVPGREANLDVLDPAVLAVNVAVLVVAVADCRTTHRLQRIEFEHQGIVDALAAAALDPGRGVIAVEKLSGP